MIRHCMTDLMTIFKRSHVIRVISFAWRHAFKLVFVRSTIRTPVTSLLRSWINATFFCTVPWSRLTLDTLQFIRNNLTSVVRRCGSRTEAKHLLEALRASAVRLTAHQLRGAAHPIIAHNINSLLKQYLVAYRKVYRIRRKNTIESARN